MGSLYRQRTSKFWWVVFYVNGTRVRKSTGCLHKKDAEAFLRRLQGQVGAGKFSPLAEKTTVEDLLQGLLNSYIVNGRKSLTYKKDENGNETPHLDQLPALRSYFGKDLAKDITPDRLDAYVAHRISEGRAPATAKNELAILHRAFNLGLRAGRVITVPLFPTISVQNARKGFFDDAALEAILGYLPGPVRPLVRFLSLTGWRVSEARGLRWSTNVDFVAGTVRLEVGETKNDDGRTFPFDVLPALRDLLHAQRARVRTIEATQGRVIPWLFTWDNGEPILDFRGSWDHARKAAGHPARLVHDLRRTAVMRLEQAGVPRSVAMALTGHKTESVYRRYAIAPVASLREGVKKLAAFGERTKRAGEAPA
jgi:integrase